MLNNKHKIETKMENARQLTRRECLRDAGLIIGGIAVTSGLLGACLRLEGKTSSESYVDIESSVTGNEQIEILSHNLIEDSSETGNGNGVVINLKNIAGVDIAKATFQAVFYDNNGNIIDTVEQDTINLEKDTSRLLSIYPSLSQEINVQNYNVKLLRVIPRISSTATGNDKIEILNHTFLEGNAPFASAIKGGGVEVSIRNVSDKTIATAVFEAVFYDLEGNVIDTVQYEDHDLEPNSSRAIIIASENIQVNISKCYHITLVSTTTTDIEKVQVRSCERKTLSSGEEQISGTLKNISDTKMDTALVTTFNDLNNARLGIVVLSIGDIEPNSSRSFKFLFKPPEGYTINSYTTDVGEIIKEI